VASHGYRAGNCSQISAQPSITCIIALLRFCSCRNLTLEVNSQVDWFFRFWPDEYAFLSNFVEEPIVEVST
jgi:hypothetical protein